MRSLPRWLDIKDVVVDVCEGTLDDARTTKAHCDTCKACFSDQSAQAKVERALSKSYQPSLDECLMDTRPLKPIKRVESFTRKLIHNSMQRVWTSIENSEDVLSRRRVLRLPMNASTRVRRDG